jgi:hypothetical protein
MRVHVSTVRAVQKRSLLVAAVVLLVLLTLPTAAVSTVDTTHCWC